MGNLGSDGATGSHGKPREATSSAKGAHNFLIGDSSSNGAMRSHGKQWEATGSQQGPQCLTTFGAGFHPTNGKPRVDMGSHAATAGAMGPHNFSGRDSCSMTPQLGH